MKQNTAIQCASNRYYQGHGVLQQLGEQAACMGRSALLITDNVVYPKVRGRVEATLQKQGITYELFFFAGYCSPASYDAATQHGHAAEVELVIGIGGGKVMDVAKIVADKLGVGAITVPTSAATCAATALLAVDYNDEGHLQGNYWPHSTPVATFADLDIILDDCPARYNIAGIVDAMAKYPEISYNIQYCPTWTTSIMSTIANGLAAQSYRLFIDKGIEWLTNLQVNNRETIAEDIFAAALQVTGLTSCLAFGGKQAAVSHCLYTYFSRFYSSLMQRYLHGELIGASLVFQLTIADGTDEEVAQLCTFLHKAGLPDSLSALGVPTDAKSMNNLFDFLAEQMPITQPKELSRLRIYEHLLTGMY